MKESLKKKIQICDGANLGRETLLDIFGSNYRASLEKQLKKNATLANGGSKDGLNYIPTYSQSVEEKALLDSLV